MPPHSSFQEGAITIALGFLGYIFIIDFPDKTTKPFPLTRRPFLTLPEARIILSHIQRGRGDAVVDDNLTPLLVARHLRD
jgi:hypothetical protein